MTRKRPEVRSLVGAPGGRLAEWSNAPHLKCGFPETGSEVRILHLPQNFRMGFGIRTEGRNYEVMRSRPKGEANPPPSANNVKI